jgi:eukaryotic-like serine/threonine-protein kinase
MTPTHEAPTPLEDEFAGRLAALDDALAAGRPPEKDDTQTAPAELQAPLARGLSMLRLLNHLRKPNPSPESDTPEEVSEPAPSSTETRAPDVGQRFGRFFVRRLLGRGGFASVFLAFDPRLGREVALKVPHPEALVTPQLRERFRIEAQAAAKLDHPNLVTIYEAGEIGPICYLVIAYCPGGSLNQWLHEQNAPVPIALAADWTRQLADAVQHAHQNGILHRDIKPGNVLLRHEAAVKGPSTTVLISDFGLAKPIEDASDLTRTGAVLGTPSYMAPEQTAGKGATVGPAADVYALGAILYELLTGHPPFAGDSPMEVLQMVRSSEPVAPRKLRPSIPRDLETICLHCLEKEPVRRYPSAAELSADLRRFVAHEPIRARPVGRAERAWRWARRNPLSAALIVALVAALFGGIGGIVNQWRRADALAVKNGVERDRADRNFGRAKQAIEHLTKLSRDIAGKPGMDRTRQAINDEILGYYQSLLEEKSDDPVVRLDASRVWHNVGRIRFYLTQNAEADAAFQQSAKLLDGLLAENPDDPALRWERADNLVWHAHTMRRIVGNDHEIPLSMYERSAAMTERLIVEYPDTPRYALTYCTALANWSASRSLRDLDAAEVALRKAVVVYRRLIAAQPDNVTFNREYAFTVDDLGYIRYRQKRYTEAEALFRDAIKLREDAVKGEPLVSESWAVLARSHFRLANTLSHTERLDEAVSEYADAATLLRKQCADHPDVQEYQGELANAVGRRGRALRRLHRDAEAADMFREAVAARERLVKASPERPQFRTRRGEWSFELGFCLSDLGRDAEAAQVLRQTLEDTPDDPKVRNEFAWLLATSTDPAVIDAGEALRQARSAIAIAPAEANNWNTLAAAHLAAGDALAALAALDRARDLRKRIDVHDCVLLALAYCRLGNADRAGEFLDRAKASLATTPNQLPRLRRQLAAVAMEAGR